MGVAELETDKGNYVSLRDSTNSQISSANTQLETLQNELNAALIREGGL